MPSTVGLDNSPAFHYFMGDPLVLPDEEVDGMADPASTIQVLDPCAEDVPQAVGLSPNLPDLKGRTVGLLENRKYHADSFLQELQQVLVEEYGVRKVVYATKFSYSAPCASDTLDSLVGQCDAVVHGVAD